LDQLMEISGPVPADNAMFSVARGGANPCPNLTPTLASGASCDLAVSYTPTAEGDKAAFLRISASSAANATLDLPISGKGQLLSYALTLTVNGSGTVHSSTTPTTPDINCSGGCGQSYDTDTVVTLAPEPSNGHTFTGWTGACTGTGVCQVTMGGPRDVGAMFADITPPNTAIISAPPLATSSTLINFTFSSSEVGSTFQCNLNGGGWDACTTPYSNSIVYAMFVNCRIDSQMDFSVRAIDPAGNVDQTPASYSWRIIRSLISIWDNMFDGGVVELQETDIMESLTFTRNINLTLKGGHSPDYQAVTGTTNIHGTIEIQSGSVTFDNIAIM